MDPLPFPEAMMMLCTTEEIFAVSDPSNTVASNVRTRLGKHGASAFYRDVLVPRLDAQGNPIMLPARETLRPNSVRPAGRRAPQAQSNNYGRYNNVVGTKIAERQLDVRARAGSNVNNEAYEYKSLKANAGPHGMADVINASRPVFQGRVILPPPLGRTMGADWRATQHYVAIKRVSHTTVERQTGLAEDTLREVEALQFLTMLPNDEDKNYILPQRALLYSNHNVGHKDDRYLYNVLEFANDRDLFAGLEAEVNSSAFHFTEAKARRYAKEMLLGLRYLHRTAGVCHLDMKIENVMLHQDDAMSNEPAKCKIIDFGACLRVPHILAANGERISARLYYKGGGTKGYRCPQVTRRSNNRNFDGFKADIWSLGIILVRMMTPFDNDRWSSLESWSRGINFRDHLIRFLHIYNPELSDGAKSFICALLTPNEDLRPTVEIALADPWLRQTNNEDADDFPIDVHDVLRAAFG